MRGSGGTSDSSGELYEQCLSSIITDDDGDSDDIRELIRCVANGFSKISGENTPIKYARSIFLVYSAALVFFMQAGFAMLCAGSVRKKNVQNTMLKNLLDACGAAVGFFVLGYGLAFGGMDDTTDNRTTFVEFGSGGFFAQDVPDFAFWMFQYAFSAASATIVAGTLAERCQMAAYLCYSIMVSTIVYPIIAHAVWNPKGFLSPNASNPLFDVGMIDFAGSGVVHLTGGTTALLATLILGPRRGRFYDESGRKLEKPKDFPGHSPALQMLGCFMLWFGWYGFNAGSALTYKSEHDYKFVALAGVNTTLAGGTAGLTALFVNLYLLERYTGEAYFDSKYAMNGALSGLVAITGGCGVIQTWAAFVVGLGAGLVYIFASHLLIRLRLDDAVDAIPCHLFNGLWGLLAVGLFADPVYLEQIYGHARHPGLVYGGDFTLLGMEILGILFIMGWVTAVMLPFFVWLDWKGWFRSDPLEEIVGLDTSYHGGSILLGNTGGRRCENKNTTNSSYPYDDDDNDHDHEDAVSLEREPREVNQSNKRRNSADNHTNNNMPRTQSDSCVEYRQTNNDDPGAKTSLTPVDI